MKYLTLKRLNFISEFLRRYSPELKNFEFTGKILDRVLKQTPSGSYIDIITDRYRVNVSAGVVSLYTKTDKDFLFLTIQFFIFSDCFIIYNTKNYSYREVNYEVFDI